LLQRGEEGGFNAGGAAGPGSAGWCARAAVLARLAQQARGAGTRLVVRVREGDLVHGVSKVRVLAAGRHHGAVHVRPLLRGRCAS